jgi:LemA protein
MPTGWIIFIAVVVVIVIYIISTQQNLVRAKENVRNSLSQIGVNQQSRFEALTQLAKAAKSYAAFESKALLDVIAARKANPTTAEEVNANEAVYNRALGQINALAEAYPQLRTSELYQTTMNSINDYENKVRTARMVYNDSVTLMNRMVQAIPSSWVASLFGFKEADYLEADASKADMPDLDL